MTHNPQASTEHAPAGPRVMPTRDLGKASFERDVLDRILDATFIGHIGLIDDGHPVVIPTAIARDGDRLLAHGSSGSRWMRALAEGAPASVAVTTVEAVVVARSTFESSIHYHSAVLFGRFERVTADAQHAALAATVERLIPGRTREARASTKREYAATMMLSMPIERFSCKVSDDWPEDEPDDVAGDSWAGIVPITSVFGEPIAAPDLRPGVPVPASVSGMVGRRALITPSD